MNLEELVELAKRIENDFIEFTAKTNLTPTCCDCCGGISVFAQGARFWVEYVEGEGWMVAIDGDDYERVKRASRTSRRLL